MTADNSKRLAEIKARAAMEFPPIALAREDVPRLLAELKAERERCAELRRLLAAGAWNLDDLDRWYCHECTATNYVGLSGTGMPPAHAAG